MVWANPTLNFVATKRSGVTFASQVQTLRSTMAVTQADIDALNLAIADGVRSVTIQGQTTIYNTTDSLIRARDDMRRELAIVTARTASKRFNRRTLLTYAGRGY